MNIPEISIIVPNYNHSKFLEQRLESIFTQTFKDFEVILLDDASTDKSINILKSYSNRAQVSELILNKKNSGSPFKQWKKGIETAKGNYIWIAESDDFADNTFLEKVFEFIDAENNKPDIVYSQSMDVDYKGNILRDRIYWTSDFKNNIWTTPFNMDGDGFIKEFLKVKNVIPNASAVVFKKDLINSSIFDEDLLTMKMCGDWLFWIRIIRNAQIGFIPESLNYFRSHSESSREHRNLNRKKNRLVEESKVRQELRNNFVDQNLEVKKLYGSWKLLHPKRKIFDLNYYRILVQKSDCIHLLKISLKS